MSNKAKVKRIIILVVIFAVVYWIADTIIYLNGRAAYIKSFGQHSPTSCPSTLWTCTEGDIFFASDEDGNIRGAARTGESVICFRMYFIQSQGRGFNVSELDSLSNANVKSWPFCFRGSASYFEDRCVITYQASDDAEHYFGEREGKVTLTFVKSELTAPFSFYSEESLNELPFR